MEGGVFVCSLCCYETNSFRKYQSHYIRLHKNDPSFSVTCGIGSCEYSTHRWNTFKVHVHRNHNITDKVHDETQGADENETDMDTDINPIHLNNDDGTRFQNALYTMSLEANHGMSQRAIDDVVKSTSILLVEQIKLLKSKLKIELEMRNVESAFIDEINVDHLLDLFDSSSQRFSFYENCSDLPYVKPVEVVLGTEHVTKKGTLIEKEKLGYYVPFKESLNKLLDLPEVWNHIQTPHYSTDEFLHDICDGDYIQQNPLFLGNPRALQIMMNTDDLEIVNPLGCHIKKHKITIFYYLLANIPPQYRSRLTAIQLVGIAKTKHVRAGYGEEKLLSNFISTLNQMSGDGIHMVIRHETHLIQGALVVVPADTLASNWLGKFKEGVAFARKKCRMCEETGTELKNIYLDRECIMRTDETHLDRCDFLNQLSERSRKYWSKLWGINGKSCLMELKNFSITAGLLQDPMHLFLEGIVPRELSNLVYYFVFTKKLFDIRWLNGKIKTFPYSYLHVHSKPEDTFDKGDVEMFAKVKQSSSSLYTLCQVLPLILGPKIPEEDQHWMNFLRLVQILLLCTSTYCHRQTASVLRILIAIYLQTSATLYPKLSFIPKKHFIVHLPNQMLQFGPLRHHWCMRFEGKHGFFKAKKMKNFKNLPYSMSRHHQLFMCMNQTGVQGEMANNFLYEGDIVANGEEINFSLQYPNFRHEMEHWSEVEPLKNWLMYRTNSVKIQGLEYHVHCALVLRYEDDIPVFGVLRDIVVYQRDKYFIIESTDTPALFDKQILHYVIEPGSKKFFFPFHAIKFKWPLSIYRYGEKLVTMNINSHTCEIF